MRKLYQNRKAARNGGPSGHGLSERLHLKRNLRYNDKTMREGMLYREVRRVSGFFSLDGPFYRFGSLLADIMILGVAWLLFSLPLFTVGASSTALFYVTTRRIANREGYILRDFWAAFKSNFKKATLLWLIMAGLTGTLAYYLLNIANLADIMGGMVSYLIPAWIVILIEIAFMMVYLFPITARFDMKFTQILKSALFMANRHIFTSVTCVALGLAVALAVYIYPIMILLAMSLYAWLASYLIMRVFKKYRPEMDKDPTLEVQEETARHGKAR